MDLMFYFVAAAATRAAMQKINRLSMRTVYLSTNKVIYSRRQNKNGERTRRRLMLGHNIAYVVSEHPSFFIAGCEWRVCTCVFVSAVWFSVWDAQANAKMWTRWRHAMRKIAIAIAICWNVRTNFVHNRIFITGPCTMRTKKEEEKEEEDEGTSKLMIIPREWAERMCAHRATQQITKRRCVFLYGWILMILMKGSWKNSLRRVRIF